MDCFKVCFGDAVKKKCGCSAPDEDPVLDCDGVCFGNASIDDCGNCTGGKTNQAWNFRKDACGKL